MKGNENTVSYDLVGNRTHRTVDGGATADDFYAYEVGSHRLASVTSGPSVRAFDYTAAGSTALDTRGDVEVEFGYGASGRLVQVTSDTGTLASRTYGYDAAGKRVRETRANRLPGGGGVISTSHGYVYDLVGHLLAEYDYGVSGQVASVRREYVWLGDTPVAMVDHAAPGDPLLAIHADHLGRPQKLTDASQAVVWDGQFDPFGEEHAVTGTTDQPLRFPGQEWDAATGLSQNWNRDYDPTDPVIEVMALRNFRVPFLVAALASLSLTVFWKPWVRDGAVARDGFRGSPLIDGFRSYASVDSVLNSENLEAGSVEAVDANGSHGADGYRSQFLVETFRMKNYQHLGCLGSMEITFFNDRLCAMLFYPSEECEGYFDRLAARYPGLGDSGKEVQEGETMIILGTDPFGRRRRVIWEDHRLKAEMHDWIRENT